MIQRKRSGTVYKGRLHPIRKLWITLNESFIDRVLLKRKLRNLAHDEWQRLRDFKVWSEITVASWLLRKLEILGLQRSNLVTSTIWNIITKYYTFSSKSSNNEWLINCRSYCIVMQRAFGSRNENTELTTK